MQGNGHIYFAAPPLPYYLESGMTEYAAGDQHPNRNNLGIFDLILVESGCLYIGEEGTSWALTSGQTLLLLPDKHHYPVQQSTGHTRFYWIHFQTIGEWMQSDQEGFHMDQNAHYERFLTSPYMLHLHKSWTLPYPEQAYRLMNKLNAAATERQSRAFWTQQQTFEELLRLMDIRQNDAFAGPVIALAEQVESYIKNHYRSEITSTTLTDAFNFHYNYITRCMKQVYGVTPGEYLMKYRLEQAKLLLLQTEWPVAEIAVQVGFENIPYFSACFSRHIGVSPTKFRKQYTI